MPNEHFKRAIDLLKGQEKLAQELNVGQSLISKINTGRQRIKADLALKIEILTKGEVTRAQLMPELFGEIDHTKPRKKNRAA